MNMRMLALASIAAAICCTLEGCYLIGETADTIQQSRINTYHISVVDASGKPVPYATIWYIQRYPSHPELTPDLMSGLLRYSGDADYIGNGDIHRHLQIAYADADGRAEITADGWSSEVKDSATSFVTIAALKRGYEPAMLADEARYVTRKDVTLHLTPEPAAATEPLLLELDRMRYEAKHSGQHGEVSEGRSQELASLQADLRDDAAQLEKENRPDAAARIYYYLSAMPGVTFRSSNGYVVRGYTNGFDKDDPQRVADREKALDLNTSVPMMLFAKATEKFFVKDRYGRDELADSAAYLSTAEKFEQHYGDHLWPQFFTVVANTYARQGDYPQACRELTEAYVLLPGLNDAHGWWFTLEAMQYGEDKKPDPITFCTIPNLPPRPTTGLGSAT